jgi:hypothetical protein
MSRSNRIAEFVWPHEFEKLPSPKPGRDINDFYYKPHNYWEIIINIHDIQTLNQIINVLKRKSYWAFVWTEQNLKKIFTFYSDTSCSHFQKIVNGLKLI